MKGEHKRRLYDNNKYKESRRERRHTHKKSTKNELMRRMTHNENRRQAKDRKREGKKRVGE